MSEVSRFPTDWSCSTKQVDISNSFGTLATHLLREPCLPAPTRQTLELARHYDRLSHTSPELEGDYVIYSEIRCTSREMFLYRQCVHDTLEDVCRCDVDGSFIQISPSARRQDYVIH
jgi:hypothetical protein